jgi:glycosyltransferase involved in cell wall biosynthesis
LGIGGAQSIVIDLMEARGPEVDAAVWSLSDRILPPTADRLATAGVDYKTLGFSKFNPFDIYRLRSLLARMQPDVLHTHLQFSSTFGVAAAVSLGRSGPRLVDHIHIDPLQAYAFWQRLGCRILAPQVAAYVAVSNSLRNATSLAFGGRARSIKVIPPGINLQIIHERHADPARVDYFRAGARRVIGTIGRLSEEKGLHVLIEATPRLLEKDPATRILIVGDGPLSNMLKQRAQQLAVSHAVAFVGYQSDVVSAYRAMDVFVSLSRYEGFGVALIEAMALKVPVIATKVKGTVDAVLDGETGILVPYNDAMAIVSAIERLFNKPSMRDRLCENAAKFTRENCSRQQMTTQIESLYYRLE